MAWIVQIAGEVFKIACIGQFIQIHHPHTGLGIQYHPYKVSTNKARPAGYKNRFHFISK